MRELIIGKIYLLLIYLTLFNHGVTSWWMRRQRRCSPKHCQVSSWGQWSQCTQTCGTTATKTRRRYIFSYPSCGGRYCPSLVQTVRCYLRCCPVNCRYVSSSWGYCYGCGTNGKRTRYNYITQRARCGGTCSVQYKETQKCNTGR